MEPPLPPLYKFLSVTGARLTLESNKFKFAKPTDFNDVEDLTIQSIFPEETAVALTKINEGLDDLLLRHVDDPPTCPSPVRENIARLQAAIRANPKVALWLKERVAEVDIGSIYDLPRLLSTCETFIHELNAFMQRFRVLCVTTDLHSEWLWEVYAAKHSGVALRVQPNLAQESILQCFRPVSYFERRPPLYESALEMTEAALFGNQEDERKKVIEKIIYSKTLKWKDDCEYRLAVALMEGEAPWDTLKFYPNEISELYLGLKMPDADRVEIVGRAKLLNPEIAVYTAGRDTDGTLVFGRV